MYADCDDWGRELPEGMSILRYFFIVGESGAAKLYPALKWCRSNVSSPQGLPFYPCGKKNFVRIEHLPAYPTNVRARIRSCQPNGIFNISCARILLEVRGIETLDTRKKTFDCNQAEGDGLVTKSANKVRQKRDELGLTNNCFYCCLGTGDEDFVWAGAEG